MLHKMIAPFELKFVGNDTGEMSFAGYASVFNVVDQGGDVVVPGAFTESLAKRWPQMLLQHDPKQPLGAWTDIKEDARGLYVEGNIADIQRGREAYQLMKMQPRPAITGLSIGYRTLKERVDTRDGKRINILEKLELFEISVVTFPMNQEANVASVKSADDIHTVRDFEKFLRDAGFSNNRAKDISLHGFKAKADSRDVTSEADVELLEALNRATSVLKI